MELVVIVYDLVLVENLAKHKSIDGITIAEVDSASGHLSHADLLDEGEVFYGGMFDGRYSRWDISFVPRRGKNRKTMDTKKYITTVKNHFLRRRRVRGSTHLLQDSAPCNKSNASKKWIREHGIEVIKWPGNSPSLNPIENLWSIFKGKLYTTKQRSPPPSPGYSGRINRPSHSRAIGTSLYHTEKVQNR